MVCQIQCAPLDSRGFELKAGLSAETVPVQ